MLQALLIVIILWIVWTVGMYFWTSFNLKKNATVLESVAFEKQSHGGQIIDLRDGADFKAEHVLGSRNIPATMLLQNASAIRKDKPVFFVDSNNQVAARVVSKLKKQGYTDMYVLKGGFAKYEGKKK